MEMLPFCGKSWHPTKTTFSVTGSTETILLEKRRERVFLKHEGRVLLERMEVPKGNRGFQTHGDLAKKRTKQRDRENTYVVLDWRFL